MKKIIHYIKTRDLLLWISFSGMIPFFTLIIIAGMDLPKIIGQILFFGSFYFWGLMSLPMILSPEIKVGNYVFRGIIYRIIGFTWMILLWGISTYIIIS